MGDQALAGEPLIEGDRGLFLLRTNDQIELPVTAALALVDASRAQLYAELADDCAASLAPSVALLARLSAAQGEMQLPTPARVDVDALIDALGADGGLLVCAQAARNLLWTPFQTELVVDDILGRR